MLRFALLTFSILVPLLGQADDTATVFGKDRFGSDSPPDSKRVTAPNKSNPTPTPVAAPKCVAREVDIQAVKDYWRPPLNYCGAAVVEANCIWDSVEKVWPIVKNDPTRYCRASKHVGFPLKRGVRNLGLATEDAYLFFPTWMFENHGATDPVLLLLPCGESGKGEKFEPTVSVLNMLKLVRCRK